MNYWQLIWLQFEIRMRGLAQNSIPFKISPGFLTQINTVGCNFRKRKLGGMHFYITSGPWAINHVADDTELIISVLLKLNSILALTELSRWCLSQSLKDSLDIRWKKSAMSQHESHCWSLRLCRLSTVLGLKMASISCWFLKAVYEVIWKGAKLLKTKKPWNSTVNGGLRVYTNLELFMEKWT